MKKVLFALASLASLSAQAGSSVTTLACSSESGKTILSGYLPGQGEMAVRLNFSVGSDMIFFEDDGSGREGLTADVKLDARAKTVAITIKDDRSNLSIRASGNGVKLSDSGNGTKGTFLGSVTGTHPATREATPSPIQVRCYASDEI